MVIPSWLSIISRRIWSTSWRYNTVLSDNHWVG